MAGYDEARNAGGHRCRGKRISSVELTERMRARIERYNLKLDAFV